MTKKYEFKWVIPVPEELKEGCSFDRWSETKDIQDYEKDCTFKVDEYGFFLYWKSEERVRLTGLPLFSVLFHVYVDVECRIQYHN